MSSYNVEDAVISCILRNRKFVVGKGGFAVLVISVAKNLIVDLVKDLSAIGVCLADLLIILVGIKFDTLDNVVTGLSVDFSDGLSVFHGGRATGKADISITSVVKHISERALIGFFSLVCGVAETDLELLALV